MSILKYENTHLKSKLEDLADANSDLRRQVTIEEEKVQNLQTKLTTAETKLLDRSDGPSVKLPAKPPRRQRHRFLRKW